MKRISFSLLLCLIISPLVKAQGIVPNPVKIQSKGDRFVFSSINIHVGNFNSRNGDILVDALVRRGLKARVIADKKSANVLLLIDENIDSLKHEGYVLDISKHRVTIKASNTKGILYGMNSFLQLLDNKDVPIPCVYIEDEPRFKWRAFMIENNFRFRELSQIRNILDKMSLYKMNVFYWDITTFDGLGIELQKYSSLRKKNTTKFYSHRDIKEILEYAEVLGITIIPVIDIYRIIFEVNQHDLLKDRDKNISNAIKSCFSSIIKENKLCDFVEEIFIETIKLFPSPVVHITNNKIDYSVYEKYKSIDSLVYQDNKKKQYSLVDVNLINKVSKLIEKHDRRMSINSSIFKNYDENNNVDIILDSIKNLSGNIVVHLSKEHINFLTDFLSKGCDVILDNEYSNLDYTFLSLNHIYNSDLSLGDNRLKKILGLSLHFLEDQNEIKRDFKGDILTFLGLYSELNWTYKHRKNYNTFVKRLGVRG
ncbi:family 20 glycosylhydrolase [Ichthyobacterium seriolicida]|uniref:beta-N-acetylhexosaminidase n=1 Tax=Ichthyobacterium seriolicida TaxID=242600 RepID=A0A1J1E503_9FLAO|nr:family 20 glycosylhydrolase [Ichthyobacterium seriolicida]BAV94390.1 beta-N-acetylhexosaminidase [Ichthyobacterium seriolicida]